MKKVLTISTICFLALGIIEQSFGQTLTVQQKEKIEKEVNSLFHEMIKTAENLNYDELNKGVNDRLNAGFIVNGAYYEKYASLASILKANIQDGANQSIKIQFQKITVLSKSLVLITAHGNASIELNSSQSFTSRFLWSFVYEKINNDWKVIHSHQSQAN